MISSYSPISTVDVGPALTCNLLNSCNLLINSLTRSRNVSTNGYMLISTVVTTAAHLRDSILGKSAAFEAEPWDTVIRHHAKQPLKLHKRTNNWSFEYQMSHDPRPAYCRDVAKFCTFRAVVCSVALAHGSLKRGSIGDNLLVQSK